MIFVNLPVRDLAASRTFYTGLGLAVNEMFSDAQVVCVVVSDAICVLLQDHARFAGCTHLPVGDARSSTQVVHCLTAASRAEVDALAAAALRSGGSEFRATQHDGPVYARTLADPDGHVWEILHMDLTSDG
ncbi:VOC family protein [Cellulomonas sp. S1-8]|uniref:VOC family protein n=1 Tax=Cellulomonas sp. S1-8 TaxID=2904790 RepID=UPI0022441321|nr:VOC family protein [Cellulomonas sp. S1-8]UZN05359.1 glyoxalase [Cellulomonas sp. S1-8]